MTSILTNASAMNILQNLSVTQASLAKTQKQISSGLAVNDASDNAGIWSIATSMRGDVATLGAVSNSISLGSSIVSAASASTGSALNLLQTLQSDLSQVITTGTLISTSSTNSISAIQSQVSAIQQSIIALMGSTSVNGVNLLDSSQSTTNIIDSYSRNPSGSSVGVLSINASSTALGGTTTSTPGSTSGGGLLGTSLSLTSGVGSNNANYTSSSGSNYYGVFANDSILGFVLTSNTKSSDFNLITAAITTAITKLNSSSVQLGANANVLTSQGSVITSITNNAIAGIGSLVDADMNVASTRLQALQTQQELCIQTLAITNQNASLILKLFGG